MRLALLTALTMIAFAGNSILNRQALAGAHVDPASFALIRLASGTAMLALLLALRGGLAPMRRRADPAMVGGLTVYMIGFSFAYLSLDAGAGALILFGVVQVTMFAGALLAREPVSGARWIGAAVAFCGLLLLLWPGAQAPLSLAGAALMIPAAVGWGLYSLRGRGASDPLGDTARNFLWSTPFALLPLVFTGPLAVDGAGFALAVASGAVTSALGYALWYALLPGLGATRAAVSQLTVPVIAALGGVLLLGEPLTLRFLLSAALVLGGVLLSLRPSPR
ncbi:EamA-like transporter family protein [Pseudoruegeria aquimaris]|uniref:EamA-like transporter family protein n=1 Tax=Pseudoruegeria aquimaris TaxID=393663 RepID=A0A1Y5TK41_9RHOB|nr:DMT family transporter [Pseudoruegeria aquimaris]SLN66171.1 EamA-like transporter family protein [Pseudoruegeria aquimaris]